MQQPSSSSSTPAVPATPHGYSLRAIQPQDADFLFRLYASTREEELRQVDWTDEQKSAFLAMQFSEQQRQYQSHYPDAGYYVIEREGRAVGRIYIHWHRGNALHLMEITVAPEERRKGTGTQMMRWLMDEAAKSAERMTLYVEEFNPAYAWYMRLGFRPLTTHGIYTLMEWRPVS